MDFSSLPKYTAIPKRGSAARADKTGPGLSPRVTRILRDLVLLVAIVAMLYELRLIATAIERPPVPASARPPLDFRLVEERYRDLSLGYSRDQVERLLGPPTHRDVWGPEFTTLEERLGNAGRTRVPPVRIWDR